MLKPTKINQIKGSYKIMDMTALLAKINSAKEGIEARKTSGINAIRPPAGQSRWRILPGWRKADRETFFHYYGKHWVKDADGKVLATYLCERDTYGRPCPVCDVVGAAIRSTKDDTVLKDLKEMTARRGVLVNALMISGTGADPNKPVLLDLPPSLFDNILIPLLASRMGDDINLLDLKEGRDVIINREGTGLSTRYTLTDAAKATAIDPSVLDRVLDIDAWLTSEKSRGDVKGVAPLNDQIMARLGIGTTPSIAASSPLYGGAAAGPTASLVSLSAPSALSAVNRTLDADDAQEIARVVEAEIAEAPFDGGKPVAAKPAAKAKAKAAEVDEDLEKMLADL